MGTVPATGGREPRPSAKNASGAWARTFICRTMSGKTSIGEPVLVCPRKPNTATIATPISKKMRKNPRSIRLVFVDDGDVFAAALFQKLAGLQLDEARITGFDDEEKSVVGRAAESPPVEDGMIPARKAVHDEHREERGESGEENGELEHYREKGRHRPPIHRFAVDDERIDEPRRPELQSDGGEQSGDAAPEDRRAQPRFAETHRRIHPVNREWRMHIPLLESGVAHPFRRFVQGRGARKFRAHPVNLISGRRSQVRSLPPAATA